jgi:hypothetical protein
LAGRSVEFDKDVLDASNQRLELVAAGAISQIPNVSRSSRKRSADGTSKWTVAGCPDVC